MGVVVLLLLTLAVVGAQWLRGRHDRQGTLERAFAQLAAAEDLPVTERAALLRAAQEQFARAATILQLEPQALVGVALTEQLPSQWGQPPPPEPDWPHADEATTVTWLRTMLQQGRVDEVMAHARKPHLGRRKGAVMQLLQFAASWQDARAHHRSAAHGKSP